MKTKLFLQPSDPSRVTRDSSINRTFDMPTFLLSSAHFRHLCSCILVNRAVVTDLIDVPIFFRRRHRVILDAIHLKILSPICLKISPLIIPELFTASRLICDRKFSETTLEWPFLALLRIFVRAATILLELLISSNYFRYFKCWLPFASSEVKADFSELTCPLGWGCRIHRLHLGRGIRYPAPMIVLVMTLNDLMAGFQ